MPSQVAHQGHGLPPSSHSYKTTKLAAATMSLMNLSPRIGLSFDGQCEAAFKFYERCLNGKIAFLLRWGESPMAKDAPAEWSGKFHPATTRTATPPNASFLIVLEYQTFDLFASFFERFYKNERNRK